MKVVFKVCCSDKKVNQQQSSSPARDTGPKSNFSSAPYDRNTTIPYVTMDGSGIAINTNIDSPRDLPPLLPSINSNASNVVQSTMSWPTWRGGAPDDAHRNATIAITSPRPTINSPINSNSNPNSNHAPSYKPTKKTSKYHPISYSNVSPKMHLIQSSSLFFTER